VTFSTNHEVSAPASLARRRARRAVSRACWVSLFWLVCLLGLAAPRVAAQAPERGVEARALFDQGVQLARQEAWSDAAVLFERSLELVARPATALNLMLVYESLQRPLDVVRMVRRLLEITDPVRHESERQQALRLEAQAFPKLAQVTLTLTPREAEVRVDGAPAVFAARGQVLLDVGAHTLEFTALGHAPHSRTLQGQAGERSELRIVLTPVVDDASGRPLVPEVASPSDAESHAVPSTRLSAPAPESTLVRPSGRARRAALALSIIGASAFVGAIGIEGLAYQRANELASESSPVHVRPSKCHESSCIRHRLGGQLR